ncbi:hypothetical protein WP7S18C02_18550 [Klebsiella sp. WP7-S18-CRE-02]|nr:hypothetical protein WP3W18E02_18430 [Klebsiella sp. WP3-W18-ESBL-02]BBR20409.1 hypothetical protein WP3S18E05_18890 [Klebsiella sp. WP3-S18-ESBL-05]BBR59422.1 hypothetical protein WP4W18E05_27900 [Klebsiella sp. WP4-W18-ESBL-05]BBS91240.1 hypothetical protein WP7S18C02_18550 [Klebsiella sp. WP7-S18-CRE-02]BBS96262.1 hypothetical protein WP7S18C03_18550 [Klebsiella sp. WP7-S18-CRE-03]BBT01294.1 hypothetical protein WP7S18E04_18560 [Klebsiella sp. WP7-S18-ESBL-04]BBT70592.1 hypothetical pro
MYRCWKALKNSKMPKAVISMQAVIIGVNRRFIVYLLNSPYNM